ASLESLQKQGGGSVDTLPFSIKILLEAVLRNVDGLQVRQSDVEALARWSSKAPGLREVPFKPARVVLQDFTGVPAVVDLAALRAAIKRGGGDPKRINPLIPCDLVIDHSVQVDVYGSSNALEENARLEFERNRERYTLLRWGSKAFSNFRLVPPATGIVHQVNLEFLAQGVMTRKENGRTIAFPDTLVGTDSHTTMINGLGVLGWGVGGIEAEAAMLGQPVILLPPPVVGFKLTGRLREGTTATDLVLTVTEILRNHGVVGKFVEFFGSGLTGLPLPDRATIANMCPEYGATAAYFPVDAETLNYLALTGRPPELIDLVERYMKAQGLFRTDDTPRPAFSELLSLDLSEVVPCLAGPKRPQDRIPLGEVKRSFRKTLVGALEGKINGVDPQAVSDWLEEGGKNPKTQVPHPTGLKELLEHRPITVPSGKTEIGHGSVVIAAITSCTNTSNPSVMVGAGLLAKKAVQRGLSVKPFVKTSLAPGSQVVTEYLESSGLMAYLEKLGFYTTGYGCQTCIGNSGPLPEPVAEAIQENDLVVAAVLSGNRNFEGRIHPQVQANYLASPPLVVAYALAGRMDLDLVEEPLGRDAAGKEVFLKEIWPTQKEIQELIARSVTADAFRKRYADVFRGPEEWRKLPTPLGDLYDWEPKSTYIQEPPFFKDFPKAPPPVRPIAGARVLILAGDSTTTDHISPAGSIAKDSPAGKYLVEQGVAPTDFNSYGSRRGNDRVMARGTFANVRFKNQLAPGSPGWWTTHQPDGEKMSIYDAAEKYRAEGVPLIVLAGKEYGSGSSRDWAAKGPALLGIRAAIAESFERIHRSNLIGMGILPLEFKAGESVASLGLTGKERFSIPGLSDSIQPGQVVAVEAADESGKAKRFEVIVRLDTPIEVDYYRHGGILHYVLRRFLACGGAG
ncbi:MAG: aconitate hydratase AcnA, partial [Candidatus Omnitrophica bacterium CG11_big_fil_rev_8_21_14_0_20_64_10]